MDHDVKRVLVKGLPVAPAEQLEGPKKASFLLRVDE